MHHNKNKIFATLVAMACCMGAEAQDKIIHPDITYAGTPRDVVIAGFNVSGMDGYEDYTLTGISGDVLVARHRVGVLSEPTVVTNPLDNIARVRRGADVGVSLRNVELRDILDARSGRTDLNAVVNDARRDLRQRHAQGRRAKGVSDGGNVRVAGAVLTGGVQAGEESGQPV